MIFILQVFRLALWFYCLFRICFLVGLLLNKIHLVFDAFDSSCCSYVHKKFKKEKEEEKIFWTRVIRPSSHFNSFSKGNFWTRDIGLLGNFFLKIFCSFKDYNFFFFPFQKPSFQENTKISIRHSLFQIMMINCSTNQFVPKKDLTSFNPCGEFCQTFKI